MSIVSGFGRRLFDPIARGELVQVRFKRRRVNPPPWIPPMYNPVRAKLYKEDRELIEAKLPVDPTWHRPTLRRNDQRHSFTPFHLIPGVPDPPDCRGNSYNVESSKRVGMVGRKIGMTLQWMKDGRRLLCTMVHFPQNVVLSANDPKTWYRESTAGKQKAFLHMHKYGPHWNQIVGAEDFDSVFLSKPYRQMFQRADVPCKKLMGGFMVSEDALVQPGTSLDVRHFQVGQFVGVSGKSVDWGFQGVVHRWGLKGLPRNRTTKAHRRPGSIGTKGEAKVWLGRRLPGHMGFQWTYQPGLLVLRVNPIEQVVYLLGNVPGDLGEMLLVRDCLMPEKRAQSLPFPTFYPDEEDFLAVDGEAREELHKIQKCTSQDTFHPRLFQMGQPSIVFTEADETKSKARDKTRAKTAKAKKT